MPGVSKEQIAAAKQIGVDDAGHIMMHWDSGSTLSLIPGVDSFSKVSAPEKAKQKRSRSWER